MEDTHKKAILASSLIKNVISKKMQFEQERKMERGEISESHPVPSSRFAARERDAGAKGSRELLRHASDSHSSSQCAEMCADEPDGSDGCREPAASARRLAAAAEPAGEAGILTKIGSLEAFKSTLLCGQNNAFRCWRDEEVEFQKDRRKDRTAEGPPGADGEGQPSSADKTIKMSHLFVPSIQLPSNNGNVPKQAPGRPDSPDVKLRSDSTLYIADSRSAASSKAPEIKINLRSARGNNGDRPGGAKQQLCAAARLAKADESKQQVLSAASRGEPSDKVPHFMVRDVRDKGKLQTPIHQVRDVRKLVKSSYHFVPADGGDNKCTLNSSDGQQQQKTRNSVSPIVIKYQSVNTNSYEKASENIKTAKSKTPESTKSDPLQKEAGLALSHTSTSEESVGLRAENGPKRQEKMFDSKEKKSEPKIPNQGALEKLQAAVKTMEQLYVFEKNEWKRKSEPQPLTDSHVLSLIASEDLNTGLEGGGARGHGMDKASSSMDKSKMVATAREGAMRHDNKDRLAPQSLRSSSTAGGKATLNLSAKSCTSASAPQLRSIEQTFLDSKHFPKPPALLKHGHAGQSGNEADEYGVDDRFSRFSREFSTDSDDYLTIPVNPRPANSRQSFPDDGTSLRVSPGRTGAGGPSQKELGSGVKLSSVMMETRPAEGTSASIYHSLPRGLASSQPQFYCFSPAVTPALSVDSFQTVERKMLLDPSSGSYYLVDTPVQLTTKRLFDPEIGQYVEVPMSQPPLAPIPIQIPHLALSPGPAYMLYPGFLPAPAVVQPAAGGEDRVSSHHQTEGVYVDSPVYMTTGSFPHAACGPQQVAPSASRPPRPLISFNPQQGARIVAPPSFDGTTMSFVVEHR